MAQSKILLVTLTGMFCNSLASHQDIHTPDSPLIGYHCTRKKAEQAEDREAVKEERRQKVDVGAILSQRKSAPANPVGKDNYPNSDKY